MVRYDGTVRNSLGDVIQFLYGEDGMDAVWIEPQMVDVVKMDRKKFDQAFRFDDSQMWSSDSGPSSFMTVEAEREFWELPDEERRMVLQVGGQCFLLS